MHLYDPIIDVTISRAALIFMILMQLLLLRYYGWQFCKAVVKQYGASGTPSAAVKWGRAPIGRRLAVFTNGFGGRSYYNTHAALQLCNITIVPREEPLGLLSCTSRSARSFKTLQVLHCRGLDHHPSPGAPPSLAPPHHPQAPSPPNQPILAP